MKTLKTLLSVFAVAAIFSTGTFAQTFNSDVGVVTTVAAQLTLTPTQVDLGTIQPEVSVLDANSNDDATETNVGTGASAGALQIQGTTGIDVTVSYTNATLENAGGTQIAFTPSVWLGTSEVTSGSNVTLAGGDITLDIGGQLAAPTEAGSYSTATGSGSPIAFTVTYN